MKNRVLRFLKDIWGTRKNTGWVLHRAGAYSYDNKVTLFASYHGQGIDEVVHNNTYDDIVEFVDIILDEEYLDEDRVDLILERISEMERSYLFSDEELLNRKNFADLGEAGDFYADALVVNQCAPGTVEAQGVLVKGENERKALLSFIPEFNADKAFSAGGLFNSPWDEWQIFIERGKTEWLLDEEWYENVTGYWNGEPVVVDMVTGSVAFVSEGEGLRLDCEGGRYYAFINEGRWVYHLDPNPPADTVRWDGDDEVARAAGYTEDID